MNKRTRVASIALAAAALAAGVGGAANAATAQPTEAKHVAKPTVVLVHGAFADNSSWNAEVDHLERAGYPVLAVDNPLRGLAEDTAYLDATLKTVKGPVILVGHSYAGMVVSQAAADSPNVKAIVYAAGLIPVKGDSTNSLLGKYPGTQLTPDNLITRTIPGGTDIYINPTKFGQVYAGGLSKKEIRIAAAEQSPANAAAFSGVATEAAPAALPKWEIVALHDHAVPAKLQRFMAERAHAHVITAKTGHDVPAAAPKAVDRAIAAAARAIR